MNPLHKYCCPCLMITLYIVLSGVKNSCQFPDFSVAASAISGASTSVKFTIVFWIGETGSSSPSTSSVSPRHARIVFASNDCGRSFCHISKVKAFEPASFLLVKFATYLSPYSAMSLPPVITAGIVARYEYVLAGNLALHVDCHFRGNILVCCRCRASGAAGHRARTP